MLPLIARIKKTSHREIAKAQDIIIEEIYSVFDNAVLHGGTAIWRCYNGNRFSEDIDMYLQKDEAKINLLFEKLAKRGFGILKKKIGANSLYSSLIFNRVIVRLEAVFKKVGSSLKEYETIEGNFITVYTLTAEELIREKIAAYLKRRKIRDLYDIFFLLRYVKEKNSVKEGLNKLVKEFKEPCDEEELKTLILEGLVPSVKKMLDYINL